MTISYNNISPSVESSPSVENKVKQRIQGRDEIIRKSATQNLAKKYNPKASLIPGPTVIETPDKRKPTTASVHTIDEDASILEACQFMAAKRIDALLITKNKGKSLVGILTDKDITYKVIAEGLDPRGLKISLIMTPNPITVDDTLPLSNGLKIMVQRHFRHLPVVKDNGTIVGLLDITQCMKDTLSQLEKADKIARKLVSALGEGNIGMEDDTDTLDSPASQANLFAEILREKFAAPTLASVFSQTVQSPPMLSQKATVVEAAKFIKERKLTAVLLVDDSKNGRLSGIFTSKDIVLRVVAAGLDPVTTSLVRVMTPHPDTVTLDTTILEALKKMHAGHYLHLPVVDGNKMPFGLIDVLQLTYNTLEQINSISCRSETSLLNQLYSFSPKISVDETLSGDTESQACYSAHQPSVPYPSQHYDQVSVVSEDGLSSPYKAAMMTNKYTFKIKGPQGAIYLSFKDLNYDALVDEIKMRFYIPAEGVSIRVCYKDDDQDLVLIANDEDLHQAFINLKSALKLPLLIYVGGAALEEYTSNHHHYPSVVQAKEENSIDLEKKLKDMPLHDKLATNTSKNYYKAVFGVVLISSVAIGAFILLSKK